MTESTLPRWSVRLDAVRPHGFGDLLPLIADSLRLIEQADAFLGPYNAKQRGPTATFYHPPEKETLRQMIRQGRINDFAYHAFLNSLVRFCETTKGTRALPLPHPSTIHSIQLPQPAFELRSGPGGSTMVHIAGVKEPIEVRGLRDLDGIKFIIVRPKLSKLGTASADKWEVLFFRQPLGYIPTWVDSDLNPRYSGKF